MYHVYVLQDQNGKLYKGLTNNLERRLREHRSGHTITTSRMTDLRVVYTEGFIDFVSARKRELYFKTAAGRKFLKKRLSLPM
jgi:putative endonuclease